MKQIIIDGRIGKDGAKILTTKTNKKPYARFSLANTSYSNGQTKTEWFDVTSYDPFVIDTQSKLLSQGKYVIIQGTINSEVTVKDGKVYLNHYIKAYNIDIPMLGKGKEEGNEVQVSTYTGGTKSDQVAPTAHKPLIVETPSAAPVAPQPQTISDSNGWSADDDLPF